MEKNHLISIMPTAHMHPHVVAWECAECAHTNEGIEPGPCYGCGAVEPTRYMIFKRREGETAPTAISVPVHRPRQIALSAAAFTRAPEPEGLTRRDEIVARLCGSLVDVVGIAAKNRGRSCPRHDVCGLQLEPGMKVRFMKERLKWRGDEEEDVLVAYVLKGVGELSCRVGFLPQHLASTRADEYDGMFARITEIYSESCRSKVKRQKMHRNEGCAVAKILGNRVHLGIS